jgi:hypothetical protein
LSLPLHLIKLNLQRSEALPSSQPIIFSKIFSFLFRFNQSQPIIITMVATEHLTGLYIAIPCYFLLLIGATYWAYIQTERIKHVGMNDHVSKIFFWLFFSPALPFPPLHFRCFPRMMLTVFSVLAFVVVVVLSRVVQLSAHYLGGRDFGPILTAGTLYASLFSGTSYN